MNKQRDNMSICWKKSNVFNLFDEKSYDASDWR